MTPEVRVMSGSGHEQLLRSCHGGRVGMFVALVNERCRCPVDAQAEQLGAVVVAARVHRHLAPVDQSEIEIGDEGPPVHGGDATSARGRQRSDDSINTFV